jgi:hypothetical protein
MENRCVPGPAGDAYSDPSEDINEEVTTGSSNSFNTRISVDAHTFCDENF